MISKHLSHYCKNYIEIENYELAKTDTTQVWVCHHRLETHFSDGTPRPANAFLSAAELKALGMYYDRQPEELILLAGEDHGRLHSQALKGRKLSDEGRKHISEGKKGKKHSEERRRINSEAHKGQIPWNKGKKGFNHSEETKQKMSESRKGHLVLEKTKIKISDAKKGKHWFNNGVTCVCCFECPEGFVPGMLKGGSKNAENR